MSGTSLQRRERRNIPIENSQQRCKIWCIFETLFAYNNRYGPLKDGSKFMGDKGIFPIDKWGNPLPSDSFIRKRMEVKPNKWGNFYVIKGKLKLRSLKKPPPQNLRREEFRFIDKYGTIPLGMNRYKV